MSKLYKYIQLYCYNNINYNGITVWGLFDSGKAIRNRNHGTCMDYNNIPTDTYKLQHSAIKYKSVTHYQLCDTVYNNSLRLRCGNAQWWLIETFRTIL